MIHLEQVTKKYRTERVETTALDNINLTVDRGEFISIMGPSGCGKSTLLNLMGLLDEPTQGKIALDGKAIDRYGDRDLARVRNERLGFVFQQFHLLSGYTALDNVADGLLYTGLDLRRRRARAGEALALVGLAHRLRHESSKLSGGERQRVAIARAIVARPSIVLADEPTGNLDSVSSAGIVSLLHELNATGSTIIVITHDHDIAASFPRTIALRDGRVESDSLSVGVGS